MLQGTRVALPQTKRRESSKNTGGSGKDNLPLLPSSRCLVSSVFSLALSFSTHLLLNVPRCIGVFASHLLLFRIS